MGHLTELEQFDKQHGTIIFVLGAAGSAARRTDHVKSKRTSRLETSGHAAHRAGIDELESPAGRDPSARGALAPSGLSMAQGPLEFGRTGLRPPARDLELQTKGQS